MFLTEEVHNFDKLLKTGKILPGIIVILSFFVMISAEYHHYHSDGNSHKECPVCVINANADSSAVITHNCSVMPFNYRHHFIIPGYKSELSDSFFAYCCPGRAPPLL